MFGKKTAEDVLKLFSQLSDEEKAKVLDGLKQPEAEEPPAETEEQPENTEENGTPDQTAEPAEGESGEEQEPADGGEDGLPVAEEETAEDESTEEVTPPATEEVAGEEAATEPPAEPAAEVDYGEVTQALAARISSLEEKLSAMEQRLADEVAKDNNQDFGSSPSLPTHDDGASRMAEVMNNYAGANARKYY